MINYFIKNKQIDDLFKLIILIIFSVVAIYFAPKAASVLFQVLLLIFFLRSYKPYFWLAFVFIIESAPGALFSISDSLHTFSLFSGAGYGNLYFSIPFLIIALYKALKTKPPYPNFILKTAIIAIGFYFIFLLAANGIYKWSAILRLSFPWLLLLIIPRLLRTDEDYAGFFRIIFLFVPFVIITQIYKLATANEFAALFGGTGNPAVVAMRDVFESSGALRPTDGIIITFIALLGTTYFLTLKTRKFFSSNYLLIITALSTFSIFLTATRSWLLSAAFIILSYTIISVKATWKTALRYVLPVMIIVMLIISIPALTKQVDLALDRYETVGYLLKGDITAGGTLKRFDVRAPKVMAKFEEKPLIGWGFSVEAAKFSDGHVGHQNLLMHSGIIGYALFLFLWILFIDRMLAANNKLSHKSIYARVPLILVVFFIAIHIINISAQWFNFITGFANAFVLAVLFAIGNKIYWQAQYEFHQRRLVKKNS